MEFIRVKNFTNVITGGTPSTRKEEYWINGEIPWLNSGELQQDIVKTTRNYITELGLNNSAAKLMPKDSILIALTGTTTGKVGYLTFEACANQSVTGILPSDNHIPKYLYYYLNHIRPKVISDAYGGAQPHISQGYVKDLKIPLPPLPEQKRIAAILDTAETYRQKTKALIEKYDQLTQSLFLEMFGDPVTNPMGWDEIKLGEICGVGSSKRVFVGELVDDGIPFYRGTEVGKLGEGKSIKPSLFIKREHYNNLKKARGVPKVGDLLMPSICPDGRIWIVDDEKEFYFKDGRVLWIEVDPIKINSTYLRYHLKGSFHGNYNNIASGTTFAELKIVALKKMKIFYPELNFQNQFADRIAKIEAQKTLAQKSLTKAEELFNALLQKAFLPAAGTVKGEL